MYIVFHKISLCIYATEDMFTEKSRNALQSHFFLNRSSLSVDTVNKSSSNSPRPSVEQKNVREPSGTMKTEEQAIGCEEPKKLANTVPPAEGVQNSGVNGVTEDPLGDARKMVQEEINREFAAMMATGTLRASEAAALAMKKVMQKYGHMNVAMTQS